MSVHKNAIVILAGGFEEIEAATIIDVLRRGGVSVTTAALADDPAVEGAHGITVLADGPLSQVESSGIDLVALPGGLPGATNLSQDDRVTALLRSVHDSGGLVAAVCAGPLALRNAGLLDGKRMTCYPSFAEEFPNSDYRAADVIRDGRVVTGSGPGTSLRFALALLRALGLEQQADQLHEGMLVL